MAVKSISGRCMFAIAKGLADAITADIPDRVLKLRLDAIEELQGYLSIYQQHGYDKRLIDAIAEKKCELISRITAKSDMERLIRPRCPYFDGGRFIPDPLIVPEEELICWSEAALRAPLTSDVCKRYKELFRQVFPKESKKVFGEEETV